MVGRVSGSTGGNGVGEMTNCPDLLPCPFCGNFAVMFKQRPLNGAWLVECPNCYARGPLIHIGHTEDFGTESKLAKKTAADRWNNNRRTAEVMKIWMEGNE